MNPTMMSLACLNLACLSLISISAQAADFQLTSADLVAEGQMAEHQVFNGFGCHGDNVAPALSWQGAPVGTQSFAVTMYDPDAPTGSGWWHWVVYNLPAKTTALPAGKPLPASASQGRTDFGTPGYGGPCPPVGDAPHRYIFTVYALKVAQLHVAADATAAMVGFMINANKLASASLQARYARQH